MTNKREIGIVGLGRMGFAISENLRDKGYRVVGFDIAVNNRTRFTQANMVAVNSLKDLCKNIDSKRIIIFSLPAGNIVDDSINNIKPFLEKDDVLLDCGNSHYKDSVARSLCLENHCINFLDVGVSGGIKGARNGACLTIGGKPELYKKLEYLFKDLSTEDGYHHVGPIGWGHLVKTIHNGIEYGFLQAIAEGLSVIKSMADKENVTIDLSKLCEVWCNGSIIESRLLNDTINALKILEENESIIGKIGGGETGTWAQKIATECGVSVPVLDAALEYRKASQHSHDFTSKIIAAIRNVFGEHELFSKD